MLDMDLSDTITPDHHVYVSLYTCHLNTHN